jgi:hypothetical protein
MGKVLVYYHIYCNEHTLPIVIDQITKIIFSGLYEKVDAINCFVAGNPSYIQSIVTYIQQQGAKFLIREIGENDTTYERFTLLKIAPEIMPDDKFLYLHSKGVTRPSSQPVFAWRNLMEYYCIAKHENCIDKLNTYDIVGVLWNQYPQSHFSGNFWWSTGKYFLSLPKYIDNNYISPEMYIGTNNPSYYSFYQTDCDLYYISIHSKSFID